VSHDGEVEVRQVDQRGGDFVAALELAQEQPGDLGNPPARPDGTEERRDGEPRIVRHRSRPPGLFSIQVWIIAGRAADRSRVTGIWAASSMGKLIVSSTMAELSETAW
jgi:hypothetical protein